ncbi:MAG: 50S ribosomal protein L18 [Elusimicrobiota bacterium]
MITVQQRKQIRKWRTRRNIKGTQERPRLSVNLSLKHISAQLIDDVSGKTLAAASTISTDLREQFKDKAAGNMKAAKVVGEAIAKKALQAGIATVVFDRGGKRYHGSVKTLADSARAAGLKF